MSRGSFKRIAVKLFSIQNLITSLLILFISISVFSCSLVSKIKPLKKERTCLVLSVGSTKGIAHIGAIDAIKDLEIPIDCVFGNSAGSIVGGVYAFKPSGDLERNIWQIYRKYEKLTKDEVKSSSSMGAIIGAGLAFLTGGLINPLFGGMVGGLTGAGFVDVLDVERFEKALNQYFRYIEIDSLEIPYGTSYKEKVQNGLQLKVVTSGNLAEAICRSSNNKFIFKNTNLKYIDPGVDRISTVPIEEAYLAFSPTKIIAINVTGEPAVYTENVKCKVIEINIDVSELYISDNKSSMNRQIKSVYNSGYQQTTKYLTK